MRILQQIKISIKSILMQGPMLFAMFCVIPLILTFVFSFINGDFMDNLQEIPTVYVQVVDNDQSQVSKEFRNLFTNEPFELVEEDADYYIEIQKGFEESIVNKETISLEVMAKKETTYIKELLVFTLIDSYNEVISESIYISDIDTIENKEAFIIQTAILKTQNSIQINYVETKANNSSFDQALLMVCGYVFFCVLYNIGGSMYMQTEGLKQRVHSLPITKVRNMHIDIMDGVIFGLVLFTSSIIAFSIFSSAVREHLLYFIPIIIIESILASVIAIFISQFLPKNIGNLLMALVMVVDMVIGGAFSSFKILKEFSPGRIISELFESAFIGNIEHILYLGGISLILCVIVYIALRFKIRWKWGKQA